MTFALGIYAGATVEMHRGTMAKAPVAAVTGRARWEGGT